MLSDIKNSNFCGGFSHSKEGRVAQRQQNVKSGKH